MTIVTITGAAKLARVSRGTIYNKIESGELSRGPDGIDSAELLRVFGQLYHPESNVNDVKSSPADSANEGNQRHPVIQTKVTVDDSDQIEWLRKLVEERGQIIAAKEKQLSEAQNRLDEREEFWTKQVTQLQALLPAPAQKSRKRFLGIF